MKPQYIAAMLTGLLLQGACASALPASGAAPSRKPLDDARFYQGVWYEIGRPQMWLTNGCVAGATEYTRLDARRVKVRDTCRQGGPEGKEKAISGAGYILDPGTNTQLRVRYFGVVRWEYRVLDHDEGYTWFISANPTFDKLWIYTRDPSPTQALVDDLTRRASAFGYETSLLEFPDAPFP